MFHIAPTEETQRQSLPLSPALGRRGHRTGAKRDENLDEKDANQVSYCIFSYAFFGGLGADHHFAEWVMKISPSRGSPGDVEAKVQ